MINLLLFIKTLIKLLLLTCRHCFWLCCYRWHRFPYRSLKRYWLPELPTREDLCQSNSESLPSVSTPKPYWNSDIRRYTNVAFQIWGLQSCYFCHAKDWSNSLPETIRPKSRSSSESRLSVFLREDSIVHPSGARCSRGWEAILEELQYVEKIESQIAKAQSLRLRYCGWKPSWPLLSIVGAQQETHVLCAVV